jgi:hypothetical protein
MNISEAFNEISNYAHFRNWAPDWEVVRKVYEDHPESYSVLSPFAYSYLEELIRSTTSEYGLELNDKNGKPLKRKVGFGLIKLAIEENIRSKPKYVELLEEFKCYFLFSQPTDIGDNRNSVVHGYMHPRFWDKESFEKLIFDIARVSPYAGF